MDIRNFFKAAGKTGGAAPPKKPSQDAKAAAPAAKPKQAAAATTAAASKAQTPTKGSAGAAAAGRGEGRSPASQKATGSNPRKRKKQTLDSDSDVEIVDDDSDEDFDAMSLEAEDDNEDDDVAADLADESSDELDGGAKRQPAKRPKPSAAASPAAAAKGKGPSRASPAAAASGGARGKGAAAAGGGRAKGGKAASRVQMVVERAPAGQSAEKRKLPGSMAGQDASVAVAPKSASKAKKAAAKEPGLPPQAQEAARLVAAAAAGLPKLEQDSLTFAATGVFGGMDERPPPNPGSKDVPRGHPDAFTGKTFVFSGVLSSMYRDAAKDLVMSHGGRVTTAVSGKTSFLVVGEQCSRRKFEAAVEKRCQVIDEDGLLALAGASAALAEAAAPQAAPAAAAAAATAAAAAPGSQPQQGVSPQGHASGGGPRAPPAAVSAMSALAFHGAGSGGGAGPSRAAAAAAAAAAGGGGGGGRPAAAGGSGGGSLWVDKYKPKNTAELVGNNTNVATLRQWLHQWEDVNLRGATPQQPRNSGGKPKDMGKKALLLAGPPGIGKTSSAHIVARELGYQVVEVNASDTRSKADAKASGGIAGKLSNVVREMVTSTALAAASGVRRKQVLVMDEVDGMSAGDRGGVADLITTIKMAKIPIICICNDKYSQKLRSLRNHCLELDFRKPTAQQVAARMSMVCRAEGLAINESTLRTLVEGGQGDLRLVLGQLQMARLRSSAIDYNTAKAMTQVTKDADMSPFAATSKLFERFDASASARPPSIMDQLDLVFADADLVPLLVQENYVNYVPDIARGMPESFRLRTLAKAADAISIGDVVNGAVRRYNNWGLWPFGALMGSVVPATYMRGHREIFEQYEQNFTRFSSWFGNYSHANKEKRLLAELSCAMAAGDTGATCSRSSVRLDYLPALRQVLTRPLQLEGEAAIPRVISTMQAYCINREQFDFVLEVTKFKSKAGWAADPMKDVETKTKSAFTRTFNKQGLKARTNTMVGEVNVRGAKGKGKGKGKAGGGGGDEDVEGSEAVAADAEGGAALAEEAPAPTAGQARTSQEEEEEEELTAEQVAARMSADGIVLQLHQSAAGGRSGRGGGRGGGRSGGRGGGGGRSGGAGGRSGGGSGRGRGRGK